MSYITGTSDDFVNCKTFCPKCFNNLKFNKITSVISCFDDACINTHNYQWHSKREVREEAGMGVLPPLDVDMAHGLLRKVMSRERKACEEVAGVYLGKIALLKQLNERLNQLLTAKNVVK